MGVNVNPQIVILFDVNGIAHAVIDGIAIPVNTPSLLLAGHDDGAIARVVRTAVDGTVRIDPTGTTIQPVSNPALDVLLSTRASEATLFALLATFSAEDFATEFTLASLLAAFNAEDFATQTTLVALLAAFNAEDFATETTLATRASEATLLTRATEATLLTRASEATLLTRATEATLALIKLKTDNLDVLLSTRASEATLLTRATEATLLTRATEATLLTRATEATLLTRATEATLLTRATEATLLTRATEATLLTRLSKADFEARINTFGQKTMAASTPVVLPSDQAVSVVFGPPGGGSVLPGLINLYFSKSDGAIVANAFKRVLTYTVPAGRAGYLIRNTTSQAEVALSRVVAETNMGSIAISTNVFTDGAAYISPQWAAIVQAEVMTAVAGGPGNVTLTVTYVNEVGTAGRTGTILIPRGSAVGSRWDMTLQGTDIGVQDITAVSAAPLVAGVAKLLGFIQLSIHHDQNTGSLETIYAPGAISFPAGTIIVVEYAGGTVSKQRTLSVLVQLVTP